MITLIQELNKTFIRTERDIRIVINRINSGRYERFIKQDGGTIRWEKVNELDYRFLSGNDPTSGLEKFYSTYASTLRSEIETQFIQNNGAYFMFLNQKVHQHYTFIKEFSVYYIDKYFKNAEEAKRLIYLLRHQPYTLSEEEVRKGTLPPPYQRFSKEEITNAIHFSLIELFLKFEDLIDKSVPNYTKLLTTDSYGVIVPQIPDYIHLNYGDRNFKVIEILFIAIKETFLDEDFLAFKAHFNKSTVQLDKLRWKGSRSLLCAIFNGVTLKNKYSTVVPKVRVSNADIDQMIADHFCNEHGAEFSKEVLRTTTSRLTTKNVQKIDLVLPALMAIEKG